MNKSLICFRRNFHLFKTSAVQERSSVAQDGMYKNLFPTCHGVESVSHPIFYSFGPLFKGGLYVDVFINFFPVSWKYSSLVYGNLGWFYLQVNWIINKSNLV